MSAPHKRKARLSTLLSWLVLMTAGCGGNTVAAFCDEVESLDLADAAALGVDTSDRPEVRAQLQRIAAKIDDVLAVAPPEIADDVAVLAGATNDLAAAVIASEGRDVLAQAQALVDAQLPWLERLEGASERYRAYVIRHCTRAP